MPIFHFNLLEYLKVNTILVSHWTTVPTVNAIATDTKMPTMTDRAFEVLR